VADAPLQGQGNDITATPGQAFSGAVAVFTDADPSGTASDFTAFITWGAGSTTHGTVAPSGTGNFVVSGSATYAKPGSHAVLVALLGKDGGNLSVSGTVQVAGSPPVVTAQDSAATAGQSFTDVVAHFTDPDSSETVGDFTAQINWGDGTTSAGTIASDG